MKDEHDWGDANKVHFGLPQPDNRFYFEIRDAETDEVVHTGIAPSGRALKLPDWLPKDREYTIFMQSPVPTPDEDWEEPPEPEA